MTNLRQKINEDLEASMEDISEWGLPVVLVAPDGAEQSLKKDTTIHLTGQVLYNRVEFNPETGEELVIDDPMVTLRINSLLRVPAPGEKWIVKIPETPDPEAPLVTFIMSPTKAMKFNRSIGILIMYLQEATQI